jgi:CubicO group peptidase (beta-lactamase class C family)
VSRQLRLVFYPTMMLRRLLFATIALPTCLSAQARDLTPLINRVFARWDSTTSPGCAVGIDRAGAPRFTRAFGSADLEYDIPNKSETVFEAGSISKQFTAAATVLLALDGKLDLADDVRKYVPELPTYERPITIRHLLNHTSGLRDWGEIAELAGWPRETRVHTHDHVLDILSRQRALNYPPGDRYSYTNSGYNLLAIIVSRVSGQPFAAFSRERLFKPLGLTSTQWRDDFRRVVKRRAQAYSHSTGQWALEMPFENVHGNGGLLTTVSDLLTWTAMLDRPTPAWKPMVDSLHVRGILTKGDTITYALGLVVSDYRGLPRVEHSGATAGYRADLLRFPGKGLAVAVLCNAASAAPTAYANLLVDSLLARALGPAVASQNQRPRPDSVTWQPNASDLAAYTGTYYSPDVETTFEVSVMHGALTLSRRPAMRAALRPTSTDRFAGFNNGVWFTRDASGRVTALHIAGGRAYDVVFERR